MDISIGSASLSGTVAIEADSHGHATISAQSCSLNIGSLKVDSIGKYVGRKEGASKWVHEEGGGASKQVGARLVGG